MHPGGSPLEVGARSFSGFSQREGDEQGSRPRLECEALPFPRERSGSPDSGRPNGRSQPRGPHKARFVGSFSWR